MKSHRKTHPGISYKSSGSAKSTKTRLDMLLVQRGLAPSRERAQAMLLAGQIRVNGERAEKAGAQVATEARIEIAGEAMRYSSRGGLKLEGALEDFGVSPDGRICLDVGSSTGGFTDCLLQHGAAKVYAVDVTITQMDWKLQQDPRVVKIEQNARYLSAADFGGAEPPDLVTIDVSFISVSKILPAIVSVAKLGADFLILVKPQFELNKGEVGKGGIVRQPELHQKAIERIRAAASETRLEVSGARPSRVTGTEGNQEYFLHARRRA
jgi:23S rRNA (cytidine1920-2'-O)/16S rRNA (cytidine1409-2'-O)-methyltransferase